MDGRTSAIFPFSTRNSLFGQVWSKKIKIVSLSSNLVPTNSNMQNSMTVFTTGNTLFGKRRQTKRDYCLSDLTEAETLR